MRCYFFGNFYLSSIQQGIQAAHVVSEMFVKYRHSIDHSLKKTKQLEQFLDKWALDYKTVVLLNGGDADALIDLKGFLQNPANPYPHAFFEESAGALNQCLTSVGIVLPETMYDKESSLVGRQVVRSGGAVYFRAAVNGLIISSDDAASPEAIQKERNYSDWELEFLGRRVVCDLAK